MNVLTPGRARALRDGLAVAGLLFAAYLFVIVAPQARTVGFDAFAYWSVDIAHPYPLAAGSLGAFTYTPVAARLFAPATLLSWHAFLFLWLAVLVATLAWLGWRRTLLVLAFPAVAIELYHGNIHLLMAAAIALGFRYPAAWAFILLTKVTPGIGLLWFAVRREWRSLGIALGVTAAITVASFAVDGALWSEWLQGAILRVAQEGVGQPTLPLPLALRLPAAALLVAWGGLTDRKWTVPAAAALALPVPWFSGLAILAALPALDRPELAARTPAARAKATLATAEPRPA
jgi:Glycosyltransferase family 87